MIININEQYRVTTDTMNFTLEKFVIPKPKDGEEQKQGDWQNVGYHADLDQCYKQLIRLGMSEADGLTDVMNYIRGLHDDFIHAVKSISYLGAVENNTKVVLYYNRGEVVV
jgi:hypothetical protein